MKDEKIFSEFYMSYKILCEKNGYTIYGAAKAAGISSGAPAAWKKGAIPRTDQRKKLCKLFGITDNELLGYNKIPLPEAGGNIGGINEKYFHLNPENKSMVDSLIEKLLMSQLSD